MEISVRSGTINEAVSIQHQIPEFVNGYTIQDYKNRLQDGNYVILVAEFDQKPVGFKVGYDRFMDGEVFYSWMGGVIPEFRTKGIAKFLLEKMEIWCKIKGYRYLKFKTTNQHHSMIHFAINHGFHIVDFEPKANSKESKIYFQKEL